MKKILILAAIMLLFESANAAQFRGVCDGITDDTQAFNDQIAAQARSRDRVIEFPSAQCAFYSQPDPIYNGISLVGQGKSSTVLIRKYSGTFLTVRGNGSRIQDLTIYADAGTSNGFGIFLVADNNSVGGNHVLRSIWVTGNGTWGIPIFLYGTERTIPPIGIRTVTAYDVSVFNAEFWAFECWDCIGFEWHGGGAYQGFGATQAIAIGGTFGVNNYVSAMIDKAASVIYDSAMRH